MKIEAPVSTPKSTTRKIDVLEQEPLSSWNLLHPILAHVDKNSFLFLHLKDWWPNNKQGLGHEKQTRVNTLEWRPAAAATVALGSENGILIWRFAVVNGNIQFAKHLPSATVLVSGHDVSSLTWSPDGKWLIAGIKNLSSLVLWDVSCRVYEMLGPFSWIESIPLFRKCTIKCIWSDDGDYLLQILKDNGFRIWYFLFPLINRETESWTCLYYATRSEIKDAAFIKDSKTVLLIMDGWIRFFSIASEPTQIELLNAPCSCKISENATGCRIQGSNLLIIYDSEVEFYTISLEPLPKVVIQKKLLQEKKWVDVGFVNTLLNDSIYYQLADGSILIETL
jgi:WD40 repeat protein